jgi:hypothetical protein
MHPRVPSSANSVLWYHQADEALTAMPPDEVYKAQDRCQCILWYLALLLGENDVRLLVTTSACVNLEVELGSVLSSPFEKAWCG